MKNLLIALVILTTPGCTVRITGCVRTGYDDVYASYYRGAQYVGVQYRYAGNCVNLNPNVCAARGY